jgi:hypothetical protein
MTEDGKESGMLQRWWVYGLVMGALLLPILTSTPVQAQDAGLAIDIDPESASPDTIVKISGHGAPANTPILVLYAPWNAAIHCRDGRHAALVAEVTADAQGQFSATHVAQQVRADQAGYTYLAKLATPGRETPGSVSNTECFTFTSTPIPGELVTGEYDRPDISTGCPVLHRRPLSVLDVVSEFISRSVDNVDQDSGCPSGRVPGSAEIAGNR